MNQETVEKVGPQIELKLDAGNKALDAVDGVMLRALGHTSSFASMKGMRVWLPHRLEKFTNCNGWHVVNDQGLQLGKSRDVRLTQDWIIPDNELNFDGVTIEPDNTVSLYDIPPWSSEGDKHAYLHNLRRIFRVPDSVIRSARPAPAAAVVAAA